MNSMTCKNQLFHFLGESVKHRIARTWDCLSVTTALPIEDSRMIIQLIKQTVKLIACMAVVLTALNATAQDADTSGISAADYVAMDLQARQLTLEGVRNRLTLLQLKAGLDAQLDQDAEIQQDIKAIYQQHNMTSANSLAWATKNKQAITDWLANNPEQQAEYDRIARELDAVSVQIQALTHRP